MTAPVADPWLTIDEAAAYAGFKPSGLRSCVNRGELRPDGRGRRKIAMFRRSTIDRFLEARARALEAPERVRLSDCLRIWMRTKHGELKASTRKHYATTLERHVLPELGDYWLDAITRDDVLAWRERHAELGLEPITINGRLRVLKTALAEVCAERGIPNPAATVKALREGKSARRKALTAAELARLLDGIQSGSPQWYPLVLALATTGARFGEVTALTWEDIDEGAGTIRIARAQWNGTIDTTKTDSARTVPLAPELVAELRAHYVVV